MCRRAKSKDRRALATGPSLLSGDGRYTCSLSSSFFFVAASWCDKSPIVESVKSWKSTLRSPGEYKFVYYLIFHLWWGCINFHTPLGCAWIWPSRAPFHTAKEFQMKLMGLANWVQLVFLHVVLFSPLGLMCPDRE